MQELKNVKNTVEKEQEKDSNSQKDNIIFYRLFQALFSKQNQKSAKLNGGFLVQFLF